MRIGGREWLGEQVRHTDYDGELAWMRRLVSAMWEVQWAGMFGWVGE